MPTGATTATAATGFPSSPTAWAITPARWPAWPAAWQPAGRNGSSPCPATRRWCRPTWCSGSARHWRGNGLSWPWPKEQGGCSRSSRCCRGACYPAWKPFWRPASARSTAGTRSIGWRWPISPTCRRPFSMSTPPPTARPWRLACKAAARRLQEAAMMDEQPDLTALAQADQQSFGRWLGEMSAAAKGLRQRLTQHCARRGLPLVLEAAAPGAAAAALDHWARRYAVAHADALVLVHHLGCTRESRQLNHLLFRLLSGL